jgi:cyclic pyranopterin phosphate synthase
MPEDEYVWLPNESILTAGEIERLAKVLVGLGAREVRLTGGEPLLRPDLVDIVARLARLGIDLALTTNGVLFGPQASALKQAGLSRVTISLDTLIPERAKALSKTTRLPDVIASLDAARAAGFERTKINTVVMRGKNDDELGALIALARDKNAEVRFIEYMDVGGATRWSMSDVVSRHEIVERIAKRFGHVTAVPEPKSPAPAQRYRLEDGTTFGVIASTTAPFCGRCDRARVTADGFFFTCLYAEQGIDLRAPLRSGASDDAMAEVVRSAWSARDDRGAEDRVRAPVREILIPVTRLRADPHREMHTRGG